MILLANSLRSGIQWGSCYPPLNKVAIIIRINSSPAYRSERLLDA
jgi:hypothetical protein